MVRQVLYAALLLSLCVLIHVTGTVAMTRAFKVRAEPTTGVRLFRPVLGLATGFVLVFFLYVLEVLVWAGAYVALGATGSLEEAVYFSIMSFTTVGYGDVVLPRDWRILGASEAAAGILIFGWSIRSAHHLDRTDNEGVDLRRKAQPYPDAQEPHCGLGLQCNSST